MLLSISAPRTATANKKKKHPLPLTSPLFLITNSAEIQTKHSDIGHSTGKRGVGGGGLTWGGKTAQSAIGLWKSLTCGSLVLRVPCVNWETQECEDYSLAARRGRHSVDTWCGTALRLSLALSPLIFSSPERCSEARARYLRAPRTRIDPCPIACEE